MIAAALLLISAAPPAILRVGQAQPFATIGQALAAAVAGDLILVDPGTYPAFQVSLPVTIAASAGGFAVVPAAPAPAIAIVGASATVAIDGAQISLNALGAAAITVHACSGDVRLQNITVDAAADLIGTSARAAIEVANCAHVVFENVDVIGAVPRRGSSSNPDGSNNGLSAVRFADTQFVLNGCRLRGYDAPAGGAFGGDAVRVITTGAFQPHSCWLLGTISSQTLIGGSAAGNGGNCFHQIGSAGIAVELCMFHALAPGAGGALAGGVYAINNDGGVVGGAGRMIPACLDVLAAFTAAPPVVLLGGSFTIDVSDFYGGGACIAALSFGGAFLHSVPGINGRVLLDLATATAIGAAALPAALPITIPSVPALAGVQLTAQSLVLSPSGTPAAVTSTPALISVR
jgi:hypothetical protein